MISFSSVTVAQSWLVSSCPHPPIDWMDLPQAMISLFTIIVLALATLIIHPPQGQYPTDPQTRKKISSLGERTSPINNQKTRA